MVIESSVARFKANGIRILSPRIDKTQRVNLSLAKTLFYTGKSILVQLPDDVPGKTMEGSPSGRPGQSPWLLALAWPGHGYFCCFGEPISG